MAATYKDIQRMTGLSLATISKYFNGGQVRSENRKAIEEAIQKLDFHVNAYARSLKSKHSRLIGGLIPELDSTFNTRMMAEAEEYLRQRGYGLIICDSRLDQESEKEALEFLLGRMVDGILTIPFDKTGQHLIEAWNRNVPVVLLDRLATEFQTDGVVIDNAEASRLAAEEFIRNGHREIAIINGPGSLYTMRERLRGFQETLIAHGLPIRQEWMLDGPITMDAGYENAKHLHEHGIPGVEVYRQVLRRKRGQIQKEASALFPELHTLRRHRGRVPARRLPESGYDSRRARQGVSGA